jgi:hydrogenase expression/formation protein HypC
MCLAVPGRLVATFVESDIHMGKVDFGGVSKTVCLEHVREAVVGDWVLVHVGFALTKLDEAEAERTFALLREIGALDELEEAEEEGAA